MQSAITCALYKERIRDLLTEQLVVKTQKQLRDLVPHFAYCFNSEIITQEDTIQNILFIFPHNNEDDNLESFGSICNVNISKLVFGHSNAIDRSTATVQVSFRQACLQPSINERIKLYRPVKRMADHNFKLSCVFTSDTTNLAWGERTRKPSARETIQQADRDMNYSIG